MSVYKAAIDAALGAGVAADLQRLPDGPPGITPAKTGGA